MRQCGRQFWTAKDAGRSKLVLAGTHDVVKCLDPACGAWHTRRKPKPPAPKKAARDTGPSPAVREIVLERDGYRCVCCGRSIIGQVYSLQHRKRRSQGGKNNPPNLLTVLGDGTAGHHARIDSRKNPLDEQRGYTVRSRQDPRLVPVTVFDGHGGSREMWPSEDGRWLDEAPVLEAAA